jgi:hypothetical protein
VGESGPSGPASVVPGRVRRERRWRSSARALPGASPTITGTRRESPGTRIGSWGDEDTRDMFSSAFSPGPITRLLKGLTGSVSAEDLEDSHGTPLGGLLETSAGGSPGWRRRFETARNREEFGRPAHHIRQCRSRSISHRRRRRRLPRAPPADFARRLL